MDIHPTAVVEDGAVIEDGAVVGPFCRIGPAVVLRAGVVLHGHVFVGGRTEIGPESVVHPFAVLGGPPQHLGYNGEDTALSIGSQTIIREHVTMSIGTAEGRGETRVGERGMFMAGAHVAHDCLVGDGVIFANNATLGGHVTVEDGAFLGGLCAVHQHCRIGANAFVGGCAAVPTDVIPFGSAVGNHARLAGLNVVGMKRRGFSRDTIHAVRAAYRDLFFGTDPFQERLERAAVRYADVPEATAIIRFVRDGGKRAIMTPER
ncbi:MAG: acyl-ACP--UDP-N-acetylglucosamine O-acyltransferase [Pseudomonadota bacterium]